MEAARDCAMFKTLYILDDDIQYSSLLAELATAKGWVVHQHNDSSEFLQKGLPDQGVLVLDLIMPWVDGIEIIQAIARQKSRLSLILISGFDQQILRSARLLAEANSIPVHTVIEKPIDAKEFTKLLTEIESDLMDID